MSENNITFNDTKIKKSNFYKTKRLFKRDNIDADKILISKKERYGKKGSFTYFIPYEDRDYIGPLYIKLPQMIEYFKCFDHNKTILLRVTDKNLLEKYTKIWRRISNLMNIESDSEPVYTYGDIWIYNICIIWRY